MRVLPRLFPGKTSDHLRRRNAPGIKSEEELRLREGAVGTTHATARCYFARWRAPVRLPRAATAAREARALPGNYESDLMPYPTFITPLHFAREIRQINF